jgi:hypothetical protein
MDASLLRDCLIFLGIAALVAIATLIAYARPPAFEDATKHAQKVGLPFTSDALVDGVQRRLVRRLRAAMVSLLMTVVCAAGLLVTPVGASVGLFWGVTVTLFCVLVAGSATVLGLHERLFSPAVAGVRVARGRVMHVGDYLDPVRRWIPTGIQVAAAGACVTLAIETIAGHVRMDPNWTSSTVTSVAIAALVALGARHAEVRVLSTSQPASDPVELAWDDLFRAETLGWLRLSTALTALLPLTLATGALVFADSWTTSMWLTWWAVPLLELAYLPPRRLPKRLRPAAAPTPPDPEPSAPEPSAPEPSPVATTPLPGGTA